MMANPAVFGPMLDGIQDTSSNSSTSSEGSDTRTDAKAS